jgi:cellobiose-specific phosphotransferase system component IIA
VMFWVVATWCRCMQLLQREAPGTMAGDAMARLREALQVAKDEDLRQAVVEAEQAIEEVRALADTIADRVGR